jgi:hypothetical protein
MRHGRWKSSAVTRGTSSKAQFRPTPLLTGSASSPDSRSTSTNRPVAIWSKPRAPEEDLKDGLEFSLIPAVPPSGPDGRFSLLPTAGRRRVPAGDSVGQDPQQRALADARVTQHENRQVGMATTLSDRSTAWPSASCHKQLASDHLVLTRLLLAKARNDKEVVDRPRRNALGDVQTSALARTHGALERVAGLHAGVGGFSPRREQPQCSRHAWHFLY